MTTPLTRARVALDQQALKALVDRLQHLQQEHYHDVEIVLDITMAEQAVLSLDYVEQGQTYFTGEPVYCPLVFLDIEEEQ